MNKKGYTMIEVIITLTVTLSLAYGVITIPARLMREYNEYQELIDETNDLNVIRSSVIIDLEGVEVEKIDTNTLSIGDSVYRFSEEGLRRDKNGNVLLLSNDSYFFDLDGHLLRIYNDSQDLHFGLSTSFNRGEINE